jgi:hypothetical protein
VYLEELGQLKKSIISMGTELNTRPRGNQGMDDELDWMLKEELIA